MLKQGDKIKHSFKVTEQIYTGFISTFNDKNPLHTDTEYARKKGFNERVMHGNILNGFISYFIGECLPSKDVIIHSQQISFSSPVYLNDALDFEAEVEEVIESVNVINFKFAFRNSSGKRVAKGEIQIGLT